MPAVRIATAQSTKCNVALEKMLIKWCGSYFVCESQTAAVLSHEQIASESG